MTRLFIPATGTRLTLSADWNLSFKQDWHNKALATALKLRATAGYYDQPTHDVTIPAGAVIKIDTYNIKRTADPTQQEIAVVLCGREAPVTVSGRLIKSSCRFYVPLGHINRIEFGSIKSAAGTLQ
jgi:hypothetical protein